MRTIYIYLSWTGWIWFVIAGTYLIVKLKSQRAGNVGETPTPLQEAKQSNEQ